MIKTSTLALGMVLTGIGFGFIAVSPTSAKGGGGGTKPEPKPTEGCPAQPQPGGECPGGKAVGQSLADLLDQIKLTTEQEDKVDDLLQAEKDAIAAFRKAFKAGKKLPLNVNQQQRLKNKIMEMQLVTRTAIEAVLTADQLEQLKALEAEACPGEKGPKPPRGDNPSGGSPSGGSA